MHDDSEEPDSLRNFSNIIYGFVLKNAKLLLSYSTFHNALSVLQYRSRNYQFLIQMICIHEKTLD